MPAADGQAQAFTTNILEVNLGKGKIRGDGGQKAIAGKATMSSPRVGGLVHASCPFVERSPVNDLS
jgi:hypothetical protein